MCVRNADIGILYEPKHPFEKGLSQRLVYTLRNHLPHLHIRCDYPYKGIADSFATHLRNKVPIDRYAGIEIEVNQKLLLGQPDEWHKLQNCIACIVMESVMI